MKHFKYPATELPWRFDWPWQCAGNWIFCNWTHYFGNRFTIGFRVFGFTKIYWIWTIKEEDAKAQYLKNQENGLKYLEKFLTSGKEIN